MLEARDLHFRYERGRELLAGTSMQIGPGEIVGLSGPSGCGKSTLGRLLAGYLTPQQGQVLIDGHVHPSRWSPVQYVPQSAMDAVNPRWRIGRIVAEGWQPGDDDLAAAGVSRSWYERYPHEVSGGQLQRVVLLRALSPATRFLVADELTTMLDPIGQAALWTHLMARSRRGLGILAISHDGALLDRVAGRRLSPFR